MNTISLNKERLIECRQKLGISKHEVSKRMKVAQPTYLRYESGERVPSIQIIQVMADVLGTSVDYLTDKTDIPTPTTYTIHSETEPELFQFLEIYKNADSSTQNQLLAYIKKWNGNL